MVRRIGRQRGIAMIVVVFLAFVVAVLLAALARLWEAQSLRDRERDLLWAGRQFQVALSDYAAVTPAEMPMAPLRLEDLLLDERVDPPLRHLRRIPVDPLTGSSNWGLVKDAQGRIAGVHSTSTAKPLEADGLWPEVRAFTGAKSYREWVFRPGVR
jgi:type II secretory pathway pseudopilin PulG